MREREKARKVEFYYDFHSLSQRTSMVETKIHMY